MMWHTQAQSLYGGNVKTDTPGVHRSGVDQEAPPAVQSVMRKSWKRKGDVKSKKHDKIT